MATGRARRCPAGQRRQRIRRGHSLARAVQQRHPDADLLHRHAAGVVHLPEDGEAADIGLAKVDIFHRHGKRGRRGRGVMSPARPPPPSGGDDQLLPDLEQPGIRMPLVSCKSATLTLN